ncbi:hypothetical protein NLU13_1424 [Sarocladium strictum]|uniref:WSC domain-containing protein n=1 Tax=Sarocladium strictum TaxID=5046 RepID=A0AA39GR79_SARSR|nr:hypothetical protein NLU13_1424 [Sarocladium strictum]
MVVDFVTTIVIQTPATSTVTIPATTRVQTGSSTGSTTGSTNGTVTGISTISTTATGTGTETQTGTGTGTGTETASPTSTDIPLPSAIGDFALSGCYESTNNFPSFTLAQSSGQMTLAICSSACASRAYFGVYQTNCYCGDFIDQSTTTPVSTDECRGVCPGDGSPWCGGNESNLRLLRRQSPPGNIFLTIYTSNGVASSSLSSGTSSGTTVISSALFGCIQLFGCIILISIINSNLIRLFNFSISISYLIRLFNFSISIRYLIRLFNFSISISYPYCIYM